MSDSVRPHRWRPTRLLCPSDFPDKSTGMGCHCLFQGDDGHLGICSMVSALLCVLNILKKLKWTSNYILNFYDPFQFIMSCSAAGLMAEREETPLLKQESFLPTYPPRWGRWLSLWLPPGDLLKKNLDMVAIIDSHIPRDTDGEGRVQSEINT